MLQENEKGGESAQSGTAKIGAIMLALASFCSSCKNDSNGFSNFDGTPSAESFHKIEEGYGKLLETFQTERRARFESLASPFQNLSREFSLQKWADYNHRALELTRLLLEQGHFELHGYSIFNSGYVFYEGAEQNTSSHTGGHDFSEAFKSEAYKNLDIEAALTRRLILDTLKDGLKHLHSRQEKLPDDTVITQLVAQLATQLPVLIERIEKGSLLADGNILNRSYRYGATSTIIGRTEYLAESIAALDYLRKL